MELKVAIQDAGTQTNNIKQLLHEFRELYQQRLTFLEMDTTAVPEELLQKKVTFLLSYVYDLADQNQVLVQTIEDLQREANKVPEVDLTWLLVEELFGLVADNQHSACELKDLKNQLQPKDRVISDLEGELRENCQQKQKLQMSSCMLSKISETLHQTKPALDTETEQRHQIQDQLCHANTEMENLQQELIRVHRTPEKKNQKRKIKICVLLSELAESKKQHSEYQKELLQKDMAFQKLDKEKGEQRAETEDQSREYVHLNQIKERLEADLALCHDKLQTLHLEMASLEGEVEDLKHRIREYQEEVFQLNQKVKDIECLKEQMEKEQQHLHDQQQTQTVQEKHDLHQQFKGAQEELNDARLQVQEQKETAMIFKQKYFAAIEKVHKVQGQLEHLQEELRYSEEQLKESKLATRSVKEELAEMMQRYQDKVGQWENLQEALDQLTDELEANQNLLRENQQTADQLKGRIRTLQEQVDMLKQQKLMLECDLRLYQQSHSHSDEEYLSLLRHRQQLQKSWTEQVECLAESEKAILQMKSELERQAQEKAGLNQRLVVSHSARISNRSQLEQEVARLELELAGIQKVDTALLRESEELMEVRQELVRRNAEVGLQRGEVWRLQEELQKKDDEKSKAIRHKHCLRSHTNQLSHELEELHIKHQVTVEELAARVEEVRQMEGRLNEGRLAEGKIRSMVVKLETEVMELRTNLQQAVDHRLMAEQEKKDAQKEVGKLRSELEEMQARNEKLCHESQLVMTNVTLWISEQKAANESVFAQLKAQKKMLITTEEKEHLEKANERLKAEVKRLKEEVEEKQRDAQYFKAQIQHQCYRQDKAYEEKEMCVALNLSKIQDMQNRLRHNLEGHRNAKSTIKRRQQGE